MPSSHGLDGAWAMGVDLGGTKTLVAQVFADGKLGRTIQLPTETQKGPAGVQAQICAMASELVEGYGRPPVALGLGVAGQVAKDSGVVRFAPNLGWHDVPIQSKLAEALSLPVAVTNDVRAIAWGEWVYGAGGGCDDLVCVFVGTGVGGGIVSGGQMLSGPGNSAGEIGHLVVNPDGPPCTCGSRGCLEAVAGGWGIARAAQAAVAADASAGRVLMEFVGGVAARISAETVIAAFTQGDPLAQCLLSNVVEALSAGVTSLVNILNPSRIILGGGVIDGFPTIIEWVTANVTRRALPTAVESLEIVRGELGSRAGVIGAAALAMKAFGGSDQPRLEGANSPERGNPGRFASHLQKGI